MRGESAASWHAGNGSCTRYAAANPRYALEEAGGGAPWFAICHLTIPDPDGVSHYLDQCTNCVSALAEPLTLFMQFVT